MKNKVILYKSNLFKTKFSKRMKLYSSHPHDNDPKFSKDKKYLMLNQEK